MLRRVLGLVLVLGAAGREPTVCPYDAVRYSSKHFVVAVEDHPLRALQADNFEGLTSSNHFLLLWKQKDRGG